MKLILIPILLIMTTAQAQDLSSHQWEDRLLLIFTEEKDAEAFVKQISVLQGQAEELEERKLVIYQITPTQFKRGLGETSEWRQNRSLYKKKNINSNFELQLIGLDGGIKLASKNSISPEEIFSKIDSMPMRRAEIRDKN